MDQQRIREVLRFWGQRIGAVSEIESTHEKPVGLLVNTFFVTTQRGERFVLKHDLDRPEAKVTVATECDVLQYLDESGVPVAVPILADNEQRLIESIDGTYLLLPVLPTDKGDVGPVDKRVVYRNMGRAVANLHRALAEYPGVVDSWTMNLTQNLRDQVIPQILCSLTEEKSKKFEETVATLLPEMDAALANLPMQHIHGDCHGGNILVYEGDVSGFIDLDHLPRGPRIYDIGYLMADFAKAHLFGIQTHANWLDNFPYILLGYEQVEPLSTSERDALWFVMLSVRSVNVCLLAI